MTTANTTEVPPGNLSAFIPRTIGRRAAEALRGASTTAGWLPSAEHVPELADTAETFHRLRRDLYLAGSALAEAERSGQSEDDHYSTAMAQAARNGEPMPDDKRTSEAERIAIRETTQERLTAIALALADVIEEAVSIVRDHEAELVARERSAHARAAEERAALVARIREIDAGAWAAVRRCQWIKKTAASDGAFDREPYPAVAGPPPPTLHRKVVENALAPPAPRRAAA